MSTMCSVTGTYILCSQLILTPPQAAITHTHVYLHRLSDKTAVVAKVSVASLLLEREFYIIKRLYQTNDGSHYLGKEVIDG